MTDSIPEENTPADETPDEQVTPTPVETETAPPEPVPADDDENEPDPGILPKPEPRPPSEQTPPEPEPAPEENPSSEEEPDRQDEEKEIAKGSGKRLHVAVPSRPRFRMRIPALRPIRTIIVLLIVILLLLLLIFRYGLGGGGGKLLPGGGEPATTEAVVENEPVEEKAEEPGVRRELSVSFFSSATDPASARELACNLDWIDRTTESQESRRIATENMIDFEFELEKAIRAWRLSLGGAEIPDIPVVSVSMTPFPGEGVFRKIEDIARRIDPKISILRLETTTDGTTKN